MLRKLAVPGDRVDGLSKPVSYQPHELSKRLGQHKVDELVRQSQAGESARSLARELSVAPSALIRLLREQKVAVKIHKVTTEEAQAMRREYEAGATMAELDKKYGRSHGTMFRALHRGEGQP